ncbi:MAG: glycosyl transferase family 4 [Desulfurococcales archaeon]|nr:glycosyl transferase family 4 [Desulfurococcales archaeon]
MNYNIYLIASSIIAFTVTLAFLRAWIEWARNRGFMGRDMNKPGNVMVPEAGGIWAVIGVAFGLLVFEAFYRYIEDEYYNVVELYGLVAVLFMSGFLGFIDDILGWKKGLKPRYRVIFMAPISLPLVVMRAGVSRVDLPLIGVVDFGVLYPLLLVPIGIVGASNAFNMIAGYNGLEAGMGALLLVFISIFSYYKELDFIFYASIIGIAGILAFLLYNWYPARVFPGNTFTYAFGSYYASLVIIGNFEKFGITLFALYFLELLLYIRGKLNNVHKENFARVSSDGTLKPPYDKYYSITHIALGVLNSIRGRATEKGVVLFILSIQALIGLVSLVAYLF